MRFVVDGSWQRFGPMVIAGSPLRIFRLTARGAAVAADLEAGAPVGPSQLVDRLLDGGAIHPRPDLRSTARFATSDVTIVTPQLGGLLVAGDGRIVVDDGSEPPLVGATLRLAVNRGPGAARNAGREFVNTPLIAFVDADVHVDVDVDVDVDVHVDVEVSSGWLDALLAHFDDPRVGLVAPRVMGERRSPLDLGVDPARIRAGSRVSYVPGAAIIVRTEAFDAIGGFDERLRFGEDVDLVWRLDQAGWSCRYEPACTVWHTPRPTWQARLQQHAAYGTSAAPLSLRHPRALSPLSINGWTAAAWGLLATGHPVGAAGVATGSATLLVRKLTGIPPQISFGLAMRGHVGAAEQLASAIRRVWWPIVLIGALMSRRLRWIGLAAVLTDVRATPTDVAYGWGVWRGMLRHRTASPIVARLTPWPPASRASAPPRADPDHPQR